MFLTLRQGAFISIGFDVVKILASILLLLIYLFTGQDTSGSLST